MNFRKFNAVQTPPCLLEKKTSNEIQTLLQGYSIIFSELCQDIVYVCVFSFVMTLPLKKVNFFASD